MKTTVALTAPGLQQQDIRQPRLQRIVILAVLGYEAAGGIAGGILLIIAPDGRLMQMPTDIMHGVFHDFFIPGIILLTLGLLNGLAFLSVVRRSPTDWWMAALALGGFVGWFIAEIIILQELHWLHLMWGLPVLVGWLALIPLIALRNATVQVHRALLACGILSVVWYVAINIYVPLQYPGYSMSSLTVSELSAINAPTRLLWVLLVLFYPLLFAAFGWGVLQAAKNNRPLRIVGALIIAYCAFNLYWPPMHMRGMETSITDTLHIVWAAVTVLLMIVMMGFGAAAFGARFRFYTILSIVFLAAFGLLTSADAPNIPVNGPTPLIGIWERINIGIFMAWVSVLVVVLLQFNGTDAGSQGENP